MAFSFAPQQQQQQNQFQTPFNNQNNFFPQQQQQQNMFQLQQPQQPQQQQPQFQQQQQQQQLYLYTNDKAPASYGTKWADLHPDSQKVLLQIEEKLLEYRGESQRLDQCSRLYDSSVAIDGFEPDATHIIQELGGVSKTMERQKAVLQELMAVVKDMLRNTEIAIRSFMMLRPRFIHPKANAAPNANSLTVATAANTQPTSTSMVPVYDFYNGFPKKPSPFLQQTVARFEKELNECRQWVEELEQLLLVDSDRHSSNSSSSLLQSLPKVMSNVHDFFVHVAAKVESIHQYIESMKAAYLADQRRRGEGNNPFLEADRRETAKQEAAAKRTHPTLHLPVVQQPSTQVAGLFATSATPVASTTPPTALPAASTGSTLSLFGTPSIAASSSSIFPTPSISASSSSIFSTPTIAASSSSLFTTPVASVPSTSLFGASPQTPAIGASTPAFGTGASLFGSTQSASFSTPFATGAAGGSGASFNSSFGTASKARAKSRPGRR